MVFVSSDANFRVQSFVLCRRGFQMTHQSTHARRRRRDDDDASKTTIPPPPPNAPFRNPEDDFVGVDGLDHHRRHPTRVLQWRWEKRKLRQKSKGKKCQKCQVVRSNCGLFFSATLEEDDIFASIRGTIEEEEEEVVNIKV